MLFMVLKEATFSLIGKVAWQVVFERFYSRLVIYSLNKLKDMHTNDVVDDTIDDIIKSLQGKRLKVVDDA